MNILALIPARMGSSRFPGKPMEKINNKTMISHVYDNVSESKLLSSVSVATCDKIIFDHINKNGGSAVMTSDTHERASDRCAEALLYLEKKNSLKYDIVLMVQGDEPMISADMIDEALHPMISDKSIDVLNLLGKIDTDTEFNDRNCIKVVCDLKCNAIYFSREPIPSNLNNKKISKGKQICVIPFRRDFLIKYTNLKPTPLEISESIDMLRVLEYGYKVKMQPTSHNSYAVDTKEDLLKVQELMIKNRKK